MKLLVTAGPTREPIDPVRYISNRSSGKMGYAVARAAVARGHEVLLISGPVSLQVPEGAVAVQVTTAAEMHKAVESHLDWCEALVMAAAVCDWRPKHCSPGKIKKSSGPAVLDLIRTADILESVAQRKGGRIFVGFAAETEDVLQEARRKLASKGLDLIVANDVSQPDSGFDVDTNRITMLSPDGGVMALPLLSKDDAGARIVEWIENRKKMGR